MRPRSSHDAAYAAAAVTTQNCQSVMGKFTVGPQERADRPVLIV